MNINILRQFLGEGKTMQPVSIYIHQGGQFEDAFENTEWRKADLMNHMGQSKKLLNQKKQKKIIFCQAHESKSI